MDMDGYGCDMHDACREYGLISSDLRSCRIMSDIRHPDG